MFYISLMKNKNRAVMTGDLVDSTDIRENYREVLEGIANDIRMFVDPGLLFDIFRGDSFQVLTTEAGDALRVAILFRAGLRRRSRGKRLEDAWDARIAIGTGEIDDPPSGSLTDLGAAGGEAFVRSGKALDTMKEEGVLLKISTGDPQKDNEFAAACPLVDTVIANWTTAQAEAVYLSLLEDLTQEEIGKRLNISQRAAGKRLNSSHIESLTNFFTRFRELMEKSNRA